MGVFAANVDDHWVAVGDKRTHVQIKQSQDCARRIVSKRLLFAMPLSYGMHGVVDDSAVKVITHVGR